MKNRNAMIKRLVLLVFVVLISFMCWQGLGILRILLSIPNAAPNPFPASDIIYGEYWELGFIDEDGSDKGWYIFLVERSTIVSRWGRPMLMSDGQTLVIPDKSTPIVPTNNYVVRPGEKAMNCNWWGVVQLTPDRDKILVETKQGLEEYAPDDCGTGNPPQKVYQDVFGLLSPDKNYSTNRQWPPSNHIVIREIITGEEKIVGEGMFPAWSPDGRWLAYTGRDGIYLFEVASDEEPKRLVAVQRPDRDGNLAVHHVDPYSLYYPPTVSWSPDGQWLVYHDFNEKLDKEISSRPFFLQFQPRSQPYSIYKVSISTGEKIKLMDGGINPFWRWDVTKE
jgi:hypothetical protein